MQITFAHIKQVNFSENYWELLLQSLEYTTKSIWFWQNTFIINTNIKLSHRWEVANKTITQLMVPKCSTSKVAVNH